MLSAAIWGTLTGLSPMAFRRGMSAWEVGERVVDVIGRTASQCILSELVGAVLESDPSRLSSVPHGLPRGQPCWSAVPVELINRAIVGGIGAALLDLALEYTDQRALGQRPLLDPDSIRRNSIAGAAEGRRLLATHLRKAAADITAVGTRLGDGLRSPPAKSIPIPVETVRLRVIAERLQIPDATDPALLDGRQSLTLRVRLDESIISSKTLDHIRIPRFGGQGALLKLDHKLLETYAQTGQTMTVELLVGAWTLEEPGSEPLRFTYTLADDPSTWLGRHAPDRTQFWRLWYRIEQVADRPSRSKAGDPPQRHQKRQSRR